MSYSARVAGTLVHEHDLDPFEMVDLPEWAAEGFAPADALCRLLSDTVLREDFGREARNYAMTEADTDRCIHKLETFYASVAARFGRWHAQPA